MKNINHHVVKIVFLVTILLKLPMHSLSHLGAIDIIKGIPLYYIFINIIVFFFTLFDSKDRLSYQIKFSFILDMVYHVFFNYFLDYNNELSPFLSIPALSIYYISCYWLFKKTVIQNIIILYGVANLIHCYYVWHGYFNKYKHNYVLFYYFVLIAMTMASIKKGNHYDE
jgi:hypothetical protein